MNEINPKRSSKTNVFHLRSSPNVAKRHPETLAKHVWKLPLKLKIVFAKVSQITRKSIPKTPSEDEYFQCKSDRKNIFYVDLMQLRKWISQFSNPTRSKTTIDVFLIRARTKHNSNDIVLIYTNSYTKKNPSTLNWFCVFIGPDFDI